MAQPGWDKLETGKTLDPGMDVLKRISEGFGVSIDFLASGDDRDAAPIPPGENHDAGRPEHTVEVPIRAIASGGPPIDAEELQGETYQLLRHLYRNGRYVIRIVGDSMYPHFWTGDLLLVEPADKVKDGAVAIVKVNGDSTVKRVFKRKKGGWILKGDNPMFPPIEADAEEVEIVGKVLKIVDGERP
jgi:SOS-response transcriptional repressor LexA